MAISGTILTATDLFRSIDSHIKLILANTVRMFWSYVYNVCVCVAKYDPKTNPL